MLFQNCNSCVQLLSLAFFCGGGGGRIVFYSVLRSGWVVGVSGCVRVLVVGVSHRFYRFLLPGVSDPLISTTTLIEREYVVVIVIITRKLLLFVIVVWRVDASCLLIAMTVLSLRFWRASCTIKSTGMDQSWTRPAKK